MSEGVGQRLQRLAAARAQNDKIVVRAHRLLRDTFATVDVDDYSAVEKALLEAYPQIVQMYGGAAADWGGQWYQMVRDAADVPGVVEVKLADAPAEAVMASSVAHAIHSLYATHDPQKARMALQGSLTRHLMQMQRTTIIDTAAEDRRANNVRAGWGIVAHPGCCERCQTLDTLGKAMYHTEETAKKAVFHDHCTCVVEPMVEAMDWKARAGKARAGRAPNRSL